MIQYRIVHIYIDEKDNVLAIPIGESPKFGGAIKELDIVKELKVPYADNALEGMLKEALSQCFSKQPDDTTNVSPLEKHLNVKGFAKAVSNKRLILFGWDCDEGYYLTPTNKVPRKGFVHMEDEIIKLGHELNDGELAKAFSDAVQLSKF